MARFASGLKVSDTSLSRAIRCGNIVKKIFEYDPDNQFAENLQIDLFSFFDIQISKSH